jgi:hypothetical protein
MVTDQNIDSAKNKIVELIADQARYGDQSKVLQKVKGGLFCLGQFLNDRTKKQRGTHGSANGLRVLATSTTNNDLVNGIIRYLEVRPEIEKQIQAQDEKIDEGKLSRDSNNTIKLSETFYGLSFVKIASAEKDSYSTTLARKLMAGKVQENGNMGWDYFLNTNRKIELLPTAFAVLALKTNGYDVETEKRSLKKKIDSNSLTAPSELAEVVFSVYVLMRISENKEELKSLKPILRKIWNSPYCTMDSDFEQDLQYGYTTNHDYVRIPWQMYLIAIASQLSKFRFYTRNLQSRLTSLVTGAQTSGFTYPHSGQNLSTRTNAILFDVLDSISSSLRHRWLYHTMVWFDGIRSLLGSRRARIIGAVLGIVLLGIILVDWLTGKHNHFSELAPHIVAPILLTIISIGKIK